MKKVLVQLSFLIVLLASALSVNAHEGLHAAGQAHIGANHLSVMEVSMLVSLAIAALFYVVKHIKDKR